MANVVFIPYYWQTYNICSRKALRNVHSGKANKRRRLTTEQLIPHCTAINYRHIISPPHRYKGTFFGFMGNSCRFVLLRGLKDNDITHCHPSSHPHTVVISLWTWLRGFNPPRLLCLTLCLQLRPTTSNPKAQMTFVYWAQIISDHVGPHTPKHAHICHLNDTTLNK